MSNQTVSQRKALAQARAGHRFDNHSRVPPAASMRPVYIGVMAVIDFVLWLDVVGGYLGWWRT